MTDLRVMVVEDDPVQACLLGLLLEGMGHKLCAVVATEVAAVAAALWARPDLIVIDERLGAGSGARALRNILGVRAVPHVVVSGNTDARNPRAGLEPWTVVLAKPFGVVGLTDAIAQARRPELLHLMNATPPLQPGTASRIACR